MNKLMCHSLQDIVLTASWVNIFLSSGKYRCIEQKIVEKILFKTTVFQSIIISFCRKIFPPVIIRVGEGGVVQEVVKLVHDQAPVLHGAPEAVDVHHVHLVQGVGHAQQRLQLSHALRADLRGVVSKAALGNIVNS